MTKTDIAELLIIAAGIFGLKGYPIPQIALAGLGVFIGLYDLIDYFR